MSQRRRTTRRTRTRTRSHNRRRQWGWSLQSTETMTTSSSPHIWSRRVTQVSQPLNVQSITTPSRKLSATLGRAST
jgi:hypothetical protein